MGLIEEKTAVITGAETEIGREIARRFFDEGASILLAGTNEGALKEICSQIDPGGNRVFPVTFDFSKDDDCKGLVKFAVAQTGRIDILVNHFDYKKPGRLDEVQLDLWNEIMGTNALAPWRLGVAVLPEMRKVGGGAIVNISSIAGEIGFSGMGLYCTSHAAVQMLFRVMAKELSPDNIRVNLICPAIVTDAEAQVPETDNVPSPELRGQGGNPKDVADAALFLVSDRSEWLTGITLNLDGGRHLSPNP